MAQPYYVAFDLDQTLGCFSSTHIYCMLLDPVWNYQTERVDPPFDASLDLAQKLAAALKQFAICLASTEKGKLCLRPGILDIVKRLSDLQDQGKIKKIVVYSNNGNRGCLKLATSMIEHLLNKPEIFCDHIHAYHPVRKFFDRYKNHPGHIFKTFKTFQKIFSYSCGELLNENSIQPQNSIFFDDIVHIDLLRTLPPTNYFRVIPYNIDADYETLTTCFIEALKSVSLDTNNEYFRYISRFTNGIKNLDDLLISIKNSNQTHELHNEYFVNDTNYILQGLNEIFNKNNTSSSSSSSSSSNNSGPLSLNDLVIPSGYRTSNSTSSAPTTNNSGNKKGGAKKTLSIKKKYKKRKIYHTSRRKAHRKI